MLHNKFLNIIHIFESLLSFAFLIKCKFNFKKWNIRKGKVLNFTEKSQGLSNKNVGSLINFKLINEYLNYKQFLENFIACYK